MGKLEVIDGFKGLCDRKGNWEKNLTWPGGKESLGAKFRGSSRVWGPAHTQ